MRTFECDSPPLTLAAWSRDARPVRFGRRRTADDRVASGAAPRRVVRTGRLDDILFGCSATALLMVPIALSIAVLVR